MKFTGFVSPGTATVLSEIAILKTRKNALDRATKSHLIAEYS